MKVAEEKFWLFALPILDYYLLIRFRVKICTIIKDLNFKYLCYCSDDKSLVYFRRDYLLEGDLSSCPQAPLSR